VKRIKCVYYVKMLFGLGEVCERESGVANGECGHVLVSTVWSCSG
jgi:hypothetical protein